MSGMALKNASFFHSFRPVMFEPLRWFPMTLWLNGKGELKQAPLNEVTTLPLRSQTNIYTKIVYLSLIHLLSALRSDFLNRGKKMSQRTCSFFQHISGGGIHNLAEGTFPSGCSKKEEQAGQAAKPLDNHLLSTHKVYKQEAQYVSVVLLKMALIRSIELLERENTIQTLVASVSLRATHPLCTRLQN